LPRTHAAVVRAVAIFSGLSLLAALFIGLGPARILSLITSLGWNFVVVVALFAGHELVRATAISRWLGPGSRPRVAELLRIRFLGEAAGALTRTGAFVAEPARAWLLARRGGQGIPGYSAVAGELVANSGTSAAVNVVVAGSLLLLTAGLNGPVVALAHVVLWGSLVYLCVVVGTITSRVRILGASARVATRLPFVGPRLRIDPGKVRELGDAISSALAQRPSVVARVLLLEVTAQAILVCEVYWAIRSMGVTASGTTALVIEVMTRAVTVVQFIGVTEAGFAAVFTWLGLPATVGFTLSLVKTLRSLTAAGIGIAFLPRDKRSSLVVI
jgi:hypothetical protein